MLFGSLKTFLTRPCFTQYSQASATSSALMRSFLARPAASSGSPYSACMLARRYTFTAFSGAETMYSVMNRLSTGVSNRK